MHAAVRCGHSEIANVLLEDCNDVNVANARDSEGRTALHIASCHGSADIVQLLLVSPSFRAVCLQDDSGRNALHHAAVHGHDEIARILLASHRFSDVAVNAVTEEDMPFTLGNFKVTTEDGVTAVHLAAKFGHVAVARTLLHSARFHASNALTLERKYSVLAVAARYGHTSVARVC